MNSSSKPVRYSITRYEVPIEQVGLFRQELQRESLLKSEGKLLQRVLGTVEV